MAPSDKSWRNGWQQQAERLAVTHAALGTTIVSAAEQTRRRSFLEWGTSPVSTPGAEIGLTLGTREIELANQLEVARARIASLERRSVREAAATRKMNEYLETLAAEADAARKRVVELESELGSQRDGRVLAENKYQSLQILLDSAIGENSHLSRDLAQSKATVDEKSTQLEHLEKVMTEVQIERNKLICEVNEANEKRRTEAYTLNATIEAMSGRTEVAEKLLADVRQSLFARTAEISANEARIAEAIGVCKAAKERLELLRNSLDLTQCQVQELQQSHSDLIQAANTLLKAFLVRDSALFHAGEKIKFLNERIAQFEFEAKFSQGREQQSARNACEVT